MPEPATIAALITSFGAVLIAVVNWRTTVNRSEYDGLKGRVKSLEDDNRSITKERDELKAKLQETLTELHATRIELAACMAEMRMLGVMREHPETVITGLSMTTSTAVTKAQP